jgi:hypothetical protein
MVAQWIEQHSEVLFAEKSYRLVFPYDPCLTGHGDVFNSLYTAAQNNP